MILIEEAPVNPFAHLFDPEPDSVEGWRPGMGGHGHDIAPFTEDNARLRARYPNSRAGLLRTTADHVARANFIKEQFPSVLFGQTEWRRIFRDRPEVFKALCAVLVEVDHRVDERPGRAGNQPSLSYAEFQRRLLRLFGKEYSFLPFAEAFKVLTRNRSITVVSRKTGIARSRVWRLLAADVQPTSHDMEQTAAAFAVHPSYFIEWRTAYVVAAIHDRMAGSPETSMHLYQKLVAPAS